jgi:hypothetical protein
MEHRWGRLALFRNPPVRRAFDRRVVLPGRRRLPDVCDAIGRWMGGRMLNKCARMTIRHSKRFLRVL